MAATLRLVAFTPPRPALWGTMGTAVHLPPLDHALAVLVELLGKPPSVRESATVDGRMDRSEIARSVHALFQSQLACLQEVGGRIAVTYLLSAIAYTARMQPRLCDEKSHSPGPTSPSARRASLRYGTIVEVVARAVALPSAIAQPELALRYDFGFQTFVARVQCTSKFGRHVEVLKCTSAP